MSDPYDLYHKLRRMAENPQASATEREVAQARMAKILSAEGPSVLKEASWEMVCHSPYDVQLFVHAAATHGCKVTPENKGESLVARGHPAHIDRVRRDCTVYRERLHNLLKLATMAALQGFGVYYEGGAPMSDEEMPFHVDLKDSVQEVYTHARRIAWHSRRQDFTLKQLPAPARKERNTLEFVMNKYLRGYPLLAGLGGGTPSEGPDEGEEG